MPKLIAKIEGSGNGIKTAVVNMSAIAKALNRSPEYTTKFFGCELGAQVQMYPKEDRWIVNGAHDGSKLQSILFNFVKKFVLCENCDNPETDLIVSRNDISQKCLACGHITRIPMVHRLASYIANHPPQTSNAAANGVPDKRSSKRDKKAKQKRGLEADRPEQPEEQQFAMGHAEDHDTSWSVDVSAEAARKRMEEMTQRLEELTVNPALMGSESDRADKFYRFVLDNLDGLDDAGVQGAVFAEAKRLGLVDKAPLILSELLSSSKIKSLIAKYQPLLLRFCDGNPRAQRYLLGGVEKIVGVVLKDELINQVPVIFMELYQRDIVDEATFRAWADKTSRKYVKDRATTDLIHLNAKPFLKWLDEADVEEESEPETDETTKKDVDVVFTFRDEKVVNSESAADQKAEDSHVATIDDEALDIDAI